MKQAPARTRATRLGGVHRTPPGLGGFDELERHRQAGPRASLTSGEPDVGHLVRARLGRPAALVFDSCFLPRMVMALTPVLCRACWSLLHSWIVRRVGVHGKATVIDGVGAQFVVPGFVAVDLA